MAVFTAEANREWAGEMAQQLEELFVKPSFETQRIALDNAVGLLLGDDDANNIANVIETIARLRHLSVQPKSLQQMMNENLGFATNGKSDAPTLAD